MISHQDSEQELDSARKAALRGLAVRPRSMAEMQTRLRRRYGQGIAHAVVGELHERGLLDDAAFAEAWRDSRDRSRPRSAALVRRELLSRGVDRAAADAAVADMDDAVSAERVAQKEMGRCATLEPREVRRRLEAALRRRGYGYRVIESTVRRILETPADGLGTDGLMRPSATE